MSRRPSDVELLLPALAEAYGPPGRETGVRAALKRAIKGAGKAREDALGNLHLHLPGKGARLLLTAHMDASGVIVTRVDSAGLARVSLLGNAAPGDLVGASVTLDGDIEGLLGFDRPKDGKEGREIEAEALFLETGIGGRAALKRIPVGTVGAIKDRASRLGELWCAANLDNRAGCAAVAAAVRGIRGLRHDVHVVFSAQSDLGARGAATGTFGIEPEVALVVDVAFLGDSKGAGDVALGRGPCVVLKEEGYLAHPAALDLVKRAAKAARVKHQWLIRESSGSDARAVRASRSGVPTVVIAIPARRTGGPCAVLDASDLEQTTILIRQVLTTPFGREKAPR